MRYSISRCDGSLGFGESVGETQVMARTWIAGPIACAGGLNLFLASAFAAGGRVKSNDDDDELLCARRLRPTRSIIFLRLLVTMKKRSMWEANYYQVSWGNSFQDMGAYAPTTGKYIFKMF
jgi:hypothetical protein